jgi:hypothetical protein
MILEMLEVQRHSVTSSKTVLSMFQSKKKIVCFSQSKLRARFSLTLNFAYLTDISSTVKLMWLLKASNTKPVNLQAVNLIEYNIHTNKRAIIF